MASIEHAEILSLNPGEYQQLLGRRWFKYGQHLQRPRCQWCKLCTSMRVPLAEWRPSRSQRGVLKKNSDLVIKSATPPEFSEERLELLNRYRLYQHGKQNWGSALYSVAEYFGTFIQGAVPMTEVTVWLEGRLVAVLMADVDFPNISAVTHFYDPDLKERSLGTFVILQSFLYGCSLELDWMYLGYYVPGSPSMAYKTQFKPYELQNWHGYWSRKG